MPISIVFENQILIGSVRSRASSYQAHEDTGATVSSEKFREGGRKIDQTPSLADGPDLYWSTRTVQVWLQKGYEYNKCMGNCGVKVRHEGVDVCVGAHHYAAVWID